MYIQVKGFYKLKFYYLLYMIGDYSLYTNVTDWICFFEYCDEMGYF